VSARRRARRSEGPWQASQPPTIDARAIAHGRLKADAEAHAAAVMPATREAQAAGAKSLRQIAAALNGRSIATARGAKSEKRVEGKRHRQARFCPPEHIRPPTPPSTGPCAGGPNPIAMNRSIVQG
jgi:hypothetical protein